MTRFAVRLCSSFVGRATANSKRQKRPSLILFLTMLVGGFSADAHAQLPATTPDDLMGLMPYAAYHGGDIDNINLFNGHLVVKMPFLNYPQRGNALRVEFDLMYNGKPYQVQRFCPPKGSCFNQWFPSGFSQGWSGYLPSPAAGVNVVNADSVGIASAVALISAAGQPQRYSDLFKVMTADNGSHLLGLVSGTGGNCGPGGSSYLYYSDWGTFQALDATGWQVQIPNCTSGVTAIIGPSGVRYGQGGLQQDSNGNVISVTSGCPPGAPCSSFPLTLTDTLGRQIPEPPTSLYSSNASTSLCPSGVLPPVTAVYWTPPGYNGGSLQYLFCFVSVPINLPPEGSAGGVSLPPVNVVQSITLPNGQSWQFAYQDTDGGTFAGQPTSFGSLTQITLPTGGTISYAYATGSGATCDLYSRWVTSRTVNANDGTGPHTWTYSYGSTTVVTDPLGNDTVHTVWGPCTSYDTSTQYYQGHQSGGTLLKTVATAYQSFSGPNSLLPTIEIPTQVTTTWPNNQVTQTAKAYDAGFTYIPYELTGLQNGTVTYGKVISQTDYDYGTGAAGGKLRSTNTSYAWQSPNLNYSSYLANNLLNLASTVLVLDGGGTQRSYTTYGYDESSLQSSGVTEQKVAGESYPGNQTSVHRWLNGSTTGTTNCNAVTNGYLVTTKAYYDTGVAPTVTDPCGYQTNYQYSGTYYGAFATQVTNALGQIMSYGYDFNTGAVTSIADWNGQPTTKNYDMLTRLSLVSYPDGGSTSLCYSDTLSSFGGACPSGPPFQVVVTKAITSSLNETSTVVFDGLGRTSQTQLNSDPSGATYTQTTYDALGRKSQVYNPTRCSPPTTNCGTEPTWGYTTTNYDPLSRVTSVVEQDGSVVSTNYSAFPCATVTDEAGHSRQSCLDGLGRMTSVLEDPGSSPHLNYTTDYTYDILGNLTYVNQIGSPGGQPRTRTFQYDSLSHLTSAQNPESGTILYAYDADGNVITKTAPLPNQTATATVTTTNTYDKLNRLTSKSYKDGSVSDPYTPTVQYGYDAVALTGCPTSPPADTDSYPVGRRTSMCDGSGAAEWTHDKMGRLLQERRTIGTVLGKYDIDAYNLDGSPSSVTTLGYSIAYTYSSAARALSATYYGTNPATKFVSSATYAPPGELAGATLASVSGGFAGFTVANAYNNRLQPILLSATSPTATVFSECFDFHLGIAVNTAPCSFSAYSTGDNGNIYQIVNNRSSIRSQGFNYDSLNRIANAAADHGHAVGRVVYD